MASEYVRPSVRVVGSIHELTQQGNSGSGPSNGKDGPFTDGNSEVLSSVQRGPF